MHDIKKEHFFSNIKVNDRIIHEIVRCKRGKGESFLANVILMQLMATFAVATRDDKEKLATFVQYKVPPTLYAVYPASMGQKLILTVLPTEQRDLRSISLMNFLADEYKVYLRDFEQTWFHFGDMNLELKDPDGTMMNTNRSWSLFGSYFIADDDSPDIVGSLGWVTA